MNRIDNLADICDTRVRCSIHLHHINMATLHDGNTVFTLAARLCRGLAVAVFANAIHALGNNTGRGSFPRPANTRHHKRLRNAVSLKGVLERAHHRVLAHKIGKGLGAVFTSKDLIGGGVGHVNFQSDSDRPAKAKVQRAARPPRLPQFGRAVLCRFAQIGMLAKLSKGKGGAMSSFKIYALSAGGGTLALSAQMGRDGNYAHDLAILNNWGPDLVISMTESQELGDVDMAQDISPAQWIHFPVQDYGVPSEKRTSEWNTVADTAIKTLMVGGRVLIHCRGGCGRSGMAVLRLMIGSGEPADVALTRLRALRPCAVETQAQMEWAFSDSTSKR